MEWILAALLGGFLTFNAVVTPDAVAKKAQSALQKKYPNATVHVSMEGKKGKAVLNGKFRKVRLELKNLAVDDLPLAQASSASGPNSQPDSKPIGEVKEFEVQLQDVIWDKMLVSQIDLSLHDLRYDLNALKDDANLNIVSFGPSTLKVRMGAKALTPMFTAKMEGVQDLVVTMQGGTISAIGKRQVLGFPAPFQFTATPGFSGNELLFENQKLTISGIPVPEVVAKPIIGKINPVYTFDKTGKWPFFPSITKVVADNDELAIEADLTHKNREAVKLETPSRAN